MTEIKQILPLVRIRSTRKDRNKFSRQGLKQEKDNQHQDIHDLRKQRANASYVDEYV